MPDNTQAADPLRHVLRQLRLRLLDLTGRNRLINFKHTAGRSLQFVHSDMEATFTALVGNASKVPIQPLPEPADSEIEEVDGRVTRPEPRAFARSLGIDCDYDLPATLPASGGIAGHGGRLQALFYSDDLGRHGRKLEREARLAIEETGANMLHLVMGFLEYADLPNSDRRYLAPLLCIPVSLQRGAEVPFPNFHLIATGEEILENLSLREKLARDHGFHIPEYDSESDETADAFLVRVAKVVERAPKWRVRRMMSLTLLSFANMLLVRELEPSTWPAGASLEGHPLIKQLFTGDSETCGSEYAAEYSIDDHPRRQLPLIYDADSSQHSALIDVLDGHNRVIEGPPGTGKSQTITNLIAAAISEGKKVLFVAEKLAALEVVKSRLSQAGLGSFVLELHSTKANKKELLEHIRSRHDMPTERLHELASLLQQTEQRHAELRAYADAMNAVLGNELGLTVHQVLWRAERHRVELGDDAAIVNQLEYFAAPRVTVSGLDAAVSQLEQLAKHFTRIGEYGPSNPFWGFFPTELKPEDDFAIQRLLREYAERFAAFEDATTTLAELLGGGRINVSARAADRILSALQSAAPPSDGVFEAECLPLLFAAEDPSGDASGRTLADLERCISSLQRTESQVATHLRQADQLPTEVVSQADSLIQDVTRLGVGDRNAAALESLFQGVEAECARLRAAFAVFASAAQLVGMDFSGEQYQIVQLSRLTSLAAAATQDVLDYRHDGLGLPDAAPRLQALIDERDRIASERTRLESLFYLDDQVNEEEIASAIQVLREGNTWFRLFQPRWRRALRVHHRLAKDKRRRSASLRLADLESLSRCMRDGARWVADPVLRSLSGPHVPSTKTPLEQLLQAAQWIASARRGADEAGISPAIFDPLATDRQTLLRLSQRRAPLAIALGELQRATEVLQAVLSKSELARIKGGDAAGVEILHIAGDRVAAVLKAVACFLSEHCHDSVSALDGLEAVTAAASLPRMREEIAAHAGGTALLKELFRGADTRLGPLWAAHSYGRKVKESRLPNVIEHLLLSASCLHHHASLIKALGTIRAGWEDCDAFAERMGAFGAFVPEQWAGGNAAATMEHARNMKAKAARASEALSQLLAWSQYANARDRADSLGLTDFIAVLEEERLPAGQLVTAFSYRFYASIAKTLFERVPSFREFSAERHIAIREEYAKLDKQVVSMRGRHVANECLKQAEPPQGQSGTRVRDKTEMRLLVHLWGQQRPKVPVRQILRRAGAAIQELMPCFMMGPQAVAQFLEPGYLAFDLVVMDEASQLRPEQTVSAIARGAQLVVVGDPKQLPPTSFFSRGAQDDGNVISQVAAADAESILDICISQFRPVRTLRWHYRSRHQSLIAFSNKRFYKGELVVFPSPYENGSTLGVSYNYIENAIYDNQMNVVEATRVVDAAEDHILTRPGDSLGIVTLNIKQRDLLAELLEERLRSLPEGYEFRERWEREGMGLFVKNLENVQGDERDCILISTTFGRVPGAAVVRQNFGPISRDGGWRRLNVLFTRARKAVAVYSSMQPEDIISDDSTPKGTRSLRSYLEFARDGLVRLEVETNVPPESDFEIAVIEVLQRRGFEVTPQLGVAGFRIDIAVRHPRVPSSYLAAIECDGATYHSKASVRDRDRIRQEILESLGWRGRMWRIWSTDWFRNPHHEAARLLAFLDSLSAAPLPNEAGARAPTRRRRSHACSAVVKEAQSEAASAERDFLLDGDEADLVIAAGDTVTVHRADAPADKMEVRLVEGQQTSLRGGVVNTEDAVGAALLGTTAGERVVVRRPGKPDVILVVEKIERPAQ
jgi:transcription elongation GreA/GreB family factor/very-short-patch-repair endonuclease